MMERVHSRVVAGFLIAALLALAGVGCSSPEPNQAPARPTAWSIHGSTREGSEQEIGRIHLTDPAGGPTRPAGVGTHGIRIVLDTIREEAVEVRVIYSRDGAADTRAFVAVAAPDEPGVYLGTVDLTAAGEWRFRIRVVGAAGGSAQISVPER